MPASGHAGEKQVGREEHEVHRALHHRRPLRAERDNAHEQGRCKEHDVLRVESENELRLIQA
jgi:hypothetical protein